MAFLNDTFSHDELQKYLDTNTFGFCCFDFWLCTLHSPDMSWYGTLATVMQKFVFIQQ